MNNQSSPTDGQPGKPAAQQQLEQHEVPEVLDFLRENGIPIVIGVVIAVAGFTGYTVWKNSKKAEMDAASNLLSNSQTAPQFQEIINNYPDTPAAPLAYLSLASTYFDQQQYDQARQTFMEFQNKFPQHELVAVAELGVAQALESLGNYSEALPAYEAFLAKNPDHFMMPSATFGKARVLEAMQLFSEAKAVYEEFIAAHPESRWVSRAETGLAFVNKQERLAGLAPK